MKRLVFFCALSHICDVFAFKLELVSNNRIIIPRIYYDDKYSNNIRFINYCYHTNV